MRQLQAQPMQCLCGGKHDRGLAYRVAAHGGKHVANVWADEVESGLGNPVHRKVALMRRSDALQL